MSTGASAPVPKDAPVMLAWEAHKQTDDFENAKHWALTIFPMIQAGAPDAERQRYSLMSIEQRETHVDGALWAMFYAGYFACAVANQAALSAAEQRADDADTDRLRATGLYECCAKERDEAVRRAEAMGRDAARYRWLRLAGVDADISYKFVSICESDPATPELFDAAIDAAIASGAGESGNG